MMEYCIKVPIPASVWDEAKIVAQRKGITPIEVYQAWLIVGAEHAALVRCGLAEPGTELTAGRTGP